MKQMEQVQLDFVSPVLGVYVEGLTVGHKNMAQSAAQIKTWLDQYLVVVLRGAHAPLWGRPDARLRGLLDHAPCSVFVAPAAGPTPGP